MDNSIRKITIEFNEKETVKETDKADRILSETLLALSNNDNGDIMQEILLALSQSNQENAEDSNSKCIPEIVTLRELEGELNAVEDRIAFMEDWVDITVLPEFVVIEINNYLNTLKEEQTAIEKLISEIEFYFSIPF